MPDIHELTLLHGLQMNAQGGLAFQRLDTLAAEVAMETAALAQLPLTAFTTPHRPVRLNVQLDAARRRTRQFVACVLKNPQLDSQSCFSLRLLALATRMKDDRAGAQQLLHANLDFVEHLLTRHVVAVGPDRVPVYFELYFTGDFAGVRAIENSICGCSPNAMHRVPSPPEVATLAALKLMCSMCDCRSTAAERTMRAHQPVAGVIVPCDCCQYGHNPAYQNAEQVAFTDKLETMHAARNTTNGKKDLATFMSAHKRKHRGTHPGPAGLPFSSASLHSWIVDLLHVDLNHGKLVWKWALTRRLP
eukprot:5801076-Pleurochrysis_carterae.AAC.1